MMLCLQIGFLKKVMQHQKHNVLVESIDIF